MRAAYSIDGHVQIDLGPDALVQAWRFGIDYSRVDHLFITHSHQDHFLPGNLLFRQSGFSLLPEGSLLTIHGSEMALMALELSRIILPLAKAQYDVIEPFRPVDLGDIRLTPVLADHAGGEVAAMYLVESEGGALLQGNDTGWFPDETWSFLAGRELSVVLLDCTYGLKSGGSGHLGAPEVVQARSELLSIGALAPQGRVIATHLSHNGGALHHELVEYFAPHGIEVAYDGMVVEV